MTTTALKIGIARALCAPPVGRLVSRLFDDRVPFRGMRIDTSLAAISPVTKAQIFWGLYEKAEIGFVRRYLRADLDVVELGSSIGVMASQVLRLQSPKRRLLCVEASSELRPAIERNTRDARPGRVTIVSAALAYPDRPGATVAFQRGASNIEGRLGASGPGATITVPATTLARLLDEHQIGDYALISDIEGAEAALIEHETAALTRCQQIIIELHSTEWRGRPLTPDDLLSSLIQRHGFRLLDRHGPVCALVRSR
jgi:FkbM family methyltransferase